MAGGNGKTNPVILVLLTGILLALVALTVVVATSGRATQGDGSESGSGTDLVTVADGQPVRKEDLPNPPEPPDKPVADPDRIIETLQAGRTYRALLKGGMTARVVDKDWGIRAVRNLAYAFEALVNRTIEQNDGRRVVELRHFETSRNVKLLCDVEDVAIDLGPAGGLVLNVLDHVAPGTKRRIESVQPLVRAVLGPLAQSAMTSDAVKALAHVDGLSGKKVRITYVDGLGVTEIEPVGCSLTSSERDFVFHTAVLSDCYILPEVNARPGESWTVDGRELGGLFDPSWRGVPEGDVEIIREADRAENDRHYAVLRVRSGFLRLNASDDSKRRIGTFTPSGRLTYSLSDGFVERAELDGRMTIEEVSKDHILFEASFRTQPRIAIEYTCRMLPR